MGEKRIGVIDSGVGGLSVVREFFRHYPQEGILYFGDTLRCPYGDKTEEEIRQYTNEMVSFLLQQDIYLLVIACNTATALLQEELQQRLDIPVIGMIEPGAISALSATKQKKIGVIATKKTIESNAYERVIHALDHHVVVYGHATPQLVPMIEKHVNLSLQEEEEVLRGALSDLLQRDIDTLVLGCTHYPLIKERIEVLVGEKITVVDPAVVAVQMARPYIPKREGKSPPHHQFYVSGDREPFASFATNWLQKEVEVIGNCATIKQVG